MRLTDKEVAEFVGVEDRTLRNWKKPQKVVDGAAVYLPHGRHNLYRGAKMATYLLDYPEDGDGYSEPYNRLDMLQERLQQVEALIDAACASADQEVAQLAKERLKEAREIVDGLAAIARTEP